MLNLNDPVTSLRGIGENIKKILNKKGIFTLQDMLYYLPVDFKNFTQLTYSDQVKTGESYLLKLRAIDKVTENIIRKNLSVNNFLGSDKSGTIKISFFNQSYLTKKIKPGTDLYVFGKVKTDLTGQKYLTAQEFYFSKPQNGFLPVYYLGKGISQNVFRKYIISILENAKINDFYSERFLEKFDLMPLNKAIHALHFPTDKESFIKARSRIVFDELLIFFRMLDFVNVRETHYSDKKLSNTKDALNSFKKLLPFILTEGQIKVMNEIGKDFESDVFMNRLIQGDVGSGKTVVAFYAMNCMANSGYQSALMAPTEVLATQHYKNATQIFGSEAVVLLTGSTSVKDRREIIRKIEDGNAKYILGTHALLYGDIKFQNLGLLITDEQHRFGVKQRAVLSKRSMDEIHILNLTATPIPRSLALTIFGNTDISNIKDMPPGRIPIKTYLIRQEKREAMFGFINDELKNGRQAYFVCPLIEYENFEQTDMHSVVEMFDEIKQYFTEYSVALLHGKMKPKEKNLIMEDFKKGKIDVLVSTTVIEVGVDVPNASVMAIQNAERFGMAQLHQLRGRVGRGTEQSYCFLISDNPKATDRLRFLTQNNDGFEIAKKDMGTRGIGEFWGFRQHGDPALKNADLFKDYKEVLKAANALKDLKNNGDFFYEYNNINKPAIEKIKELNDDIIMN